MIWAGSQFPREAEAQTRFKVRGGDPATVFPQSVASGDPQPNGIVLWTRIGSLKGGSTVAYEITRDTTFRKPILRGTAQTSADRDNTVKVQINRTELSPFTTYYYRFIYNGIASRTGRFKTLPAETGAVPGDRGVRFGYISCQDYTNGYYTALAHLAQEDVDFVVHLGDYIYETVGEESFQGGGPTERQFSFPDGGDEALTLRDYRFAYGQYKSDKNLQAVHEKFAFITIWDDHEFANDAYQTTAPDAASGTTAVPERREAANQAWAEYTQTGVPYDPSGGPLEEIQIYRSFAFGDLMELVMTDQRLYRDGPPCGDTTPERYLTPGCEAVNDPNRTTLGSDQKTWFLDKIRSSPRTWKIWGSELQFGQCKLLNTYLQGGAPEIFPTVVQGPEQLGGVYVTLDNWDGYQAERLEITQAIKSSGVKNFVVITGDIHTFIANYVKEAYDNPLDPPVGVEFVCGSVTSSNLTEIATFGQGTGAIPRPSDPDAFTLAAKASNPHYEYFNSDTHGYNIMEVTPAGLSCTMVAVSTIKQAQAEKSILKRFRVPVNEVSIIDETSPVPTSAGA
jgi:alkaline phosphatase D